MKNLLFSSYFDRNKFEHMLPNENASLLILFNWNTKQKNNQFMCKTFEAFVRRDVRKTISEQ